MRSFRTRAGIGGAAILLALLSPLPAGPAQATPSASQARGNAAQPDVRQIPPDRTYPLDRSLAAQKAKQSSEATRGPQSLRTQAATAATPPVGTVRTWLALDDFKGLLYPKRYELRGVGDKIEVWVATDRDAVSTGTAFPTSDCRSPVPGSTEITDAQVARLISEFDTTMLPKESAAFSVARDRDGSNSLLSGEFSGDGDKTVTLVDNVRDDNFYEFPANPTYIAGFFSSQFNELVDRNVMTIDAFDWLHRTGTNPPDRATDDLCTSRPARPLLYEGVFAHEYQHLLHYYQDPGESTFINEGLSDFAVTLVGYADATASVFDPGAQSHIYCFQGFGTIRTPFNPNPRDCGGPQNSLTLWGDDGDGNEILADYGNAWSFILFLYDRYGPDFITALHRDGDARGLASVQRQLDALAGGRSVFRVLHDFQVMSLLDTFVDRRRGRVFGAAKSRVTTESLDATVNLLNPMSHAKSGASPNGADYVGLRGRGPAFLSGKQLRSLSFDGAETLPSLPLRWTIVTDAPGRAGNTTLWSGNTSNLDSAAATRVTVPADNPTLTYTERHLAEPRFDYAYTVVSTDGGETYVPLANANTVAGPLGPALNGDSPAFATQTFDLAAYAGQTVLVGFRYVSDGGVNDGGWYVDDVSVGSTLISDGSSLDPFDSPTEANPIEVANWVVRLVGLDTTKRKALVRTYEGSSSLNLGRGPLAQFRSYPLVVAIIGYDDPTEQVQQYAPYTLTVNGVTQPGG